MKINSSSHDPDIVMDETVYLSSGAVVITGFNDSKGRPIIVNPKKSDGKKKKECKTCWGWGIWGVGYPAPMGEMDAEDGMPTKACPECKANPNPMGAEE